MGFNDRDYYGQQQPGVQLRGPSSVVGLLIAINVGIWIADGLLTPDPNDVHSIHGLLALHVETLRNPWLWWQFLTYGFAHAPFSQGIGHIFGNMLGLFFFGQAIEQRYGAWEFLTFYLVTIVVCGLAWCTIGMATGAPPMSSVIGASGAITAIVVLFIFLYPKQMVLLFFVIPMPAWVLGVVLVGLDLLGATGHGAGDVAYTVHLAGAAFALFYFRFDWRLSTLYLRIVNRFKRRPKLRVHDPDTSPLPIDKMDEEEDRILAKIHREGVESLTKKERKTLEEISRRYKKRGR